MSCADLIRRLGYECREVGTGIIAVATPFTFPDGEPIQFYLDSNGSQLIVHDNADTIAHLMGMGWELGDRKKWKSLKNAVSAFGYHLADSGVIVGRSSKALETDFLARYVATMLAVVNMEREYLGLSDEQIAFVEEVELYLRASRPSGTLKHRPTIMGHSGREHEFHFDFDGELIDAAKPRGQSTGAILRKAADVNNAGNTMRILVVIDDRIEAEKAKTETDILSTMVSVLPFTTLANQGAGTSTKH
jgi:hypothetical protein